MTKRDEQRALKALQGLDFPASKRTILDYAETRSADEKTKQALSALPDREYRNLDDVEQAVPQQPDRE